MGTNLRESSRPLTRRCAVQAEAGSRVELYEAQISKMQRTLERADQENSRLEQELRALQEGAAARGQAERRGSSSLAALRDRVRSISLLSSPLEQQAAERLQVPTPVLGPPPLWSGFVLCCVRMLQMHS